MKTKGAFAIIADTDNKILLVKRRDVPFWDLPGGTKEFSESEKDCVIREVEEETGLIIETLYLVGQYDQIKRNDLQYIFYTKVIGGHLIESGPETKEIAFFNLKKLPINMIPLRRKQIKDFFKDSKEQVYIVKSVNILYFL